MSVFARDQDFFDAKLSIRAMAGILWIFCSNLHLSPDKSSLLLELAIVSSVCSSKSSLNSTFL